MIYGFAKDSHYYISHHGRKGQKWGVLNGPPYPLSRQALAGSQYAIGGKGSRIWKKRSDAEENIDPKTGLKLKTWEYSRTEDLAATNPLQKKIVGYSWNNCSCCVTAYDLRRRGFDVVAGDPKDFRKHGATESKLKHFYEGLDPSDYFYKDVKDIPRNLSKENSDKLYKYASEKILEQGNGARGILAVQRKNNGHALCYENAGGKILVLDPQANRRYNLRDVSDISLDIGVFRLDDKEPNYEWLKKVEVIQNA